MKIYSGPEQLAILDRMTRIRDVIDSYPHNGITLAQRESLYEDLYMLADKLEKISA